MRVAVLLAVLLLFFGVALFSPLHKHTLGKSNSCSFNNLEYQWVSLAEAAVVILPQVVWLDAVPPTAILAACDKQQIAVRDRSPPSFS